MKDFNMKNDVLYENLVMAIREKYPERGKLTNMLADLLMIEKEAVYRRLRGDVPFTIFEIAAIANKLISPSIILSVVPEKEQAFSDEDGKFPPSKGGGLQDAGTFSRWLEVS